MKYFKDITLQTIVELFAFFSIQDEEEVEMLDHSYVQQYLSIRFSKKVMHEMLDYYQDFARSLGAQSHQNSFFIKKVSYSINILTQELSRSQKVELYIALLDYVVDNEVVIEKKSHIDRLHAQLDVVKIGFDLPSEELKAISGFIHDDLEFEDVPESIIVVGNFKRFQLHSFRMLQKDDFKGTLTALYVESLSSFLIKYDGTDELSLNMQVIFPERIYQFSQGGIIAGPSIESLFFSNLFMVLKHKEEDHINIYCKDLSKTFKNTNLGVKRLSFEVESGQLMAVMGGSGTGKTTLFRLLSGSMIPDKGKVLVNGHELHENMPLLKKHIGYVPQEDLLIEELTVYQNLLYSTQLCRNDLSKEQVSNLVRNTLKEMGLETIKDLKVGSPLDKVISGGQRKRLNIALELVRKPGILFVDEPTSGLSSADSLRVMKLLKSIVLKGKIVIVNIHQPTSDIFFLLDKLLLLDENGYAAYFGNPLAASGYFKKHLGLVDSIRDEGVNYQQFNPEQLMQLIEYKKTSSEGEELERRMVENTGWHRYFMDSSCKNKGKVEKKRLSQGTTSIPNVFEQLVIFFKRNVMTRITDFYYMLMVFTGAPGLALLMSFFLKSTDHVTHEYRFIENDNIPAYLFISVIVSMFLGLIISSSEIFRDLKIIKRESFLSLSPWAYLNSKVFYVLIVDALLVVMFVSIGNSILEIKGLFWQYSLILWLTAVFSSMLGLLISTVMRTILSIYIMIPFLLIPQILLAGAILDFDKIHHLVASDKYVPIYADVNVSRWAYESLVVLQFTNNEYVKGSVDEMIKQSELVYYVNFVIPKIETLLGDVNSFEGEAMGKVELLIGDLAKHFPEVKESLIGLSVNENNLPKIRSVLQKVKKWMRLMLKESKAHLENFRSTNNKIDKKDYYNLKLADFVLENGNYEKYIYVNGEMIRRYHPGYYVSDNKFGRSHYYAPYKRIGNYMIKTWVFNMYVMLLGIVIIYFIVLYRLKRDKF